jgi:acyl-CoA synthetase (NDP forming)
MTTIQDLLAPRSVAVIGASDDPTRIGGRPIAYMRAAGYEGRLIPVNPNRSTVQGLAAVPSVMDIDGTIDFALIAVPAKHVAQTIRDAGAKGAKAALCFSSGFAEMGEAGAALEVEVIRAARETGVRLIGPNCLGAFNAETGFIPCFSSALERGAPITGGLAIVSQSGAYGSHIYWLARQRGLGTRYFMTTGNEADVGVSEVIGLMADDPDVHCIMAYAEGIRNGPQLIESLEKARAARKPVFVMKVGRSAVGAAAASSHTASLAGEDAVHDAILRQHGAVRVRTTEEMLDAADAARTRVYPVGNRLGVVTISGGAGVLIADEADARGLDVAPMPEDAQAELREILPFAAPRNPVDVTAQAFNDLNLVTLFLQKMIERGDYDSLLCFWTSVAGSAIMADKLLAAMRAGIAGQKGLLVVQSIIADAAVTKRYTDDGYPVFEDPSRAVAAIDALTRAGMAFAAGRPVMPPVPAPAALPDGPLTEGVAAAALAIAGVPMATAALACSAGDAAALAAAAGGPVAIKIASPDIAHKTDAGGVALGVAPEDAAAAFDAMMIRVRGHAPDAVIEGALISAMAPPGVDLILGAKTDPAFGPVVMVGLGGVFAEVFHDVAFRRAPVTHGVALEMLRSLRGWPLLDGARGAALADVDAAAAAVSALSIFAASQGAAIDSVEINPLRVLPAGQGALGLDALIVRGG